MSDAMGSKPRPPPPTGPLGPPPNNVKKKDPYATAWRTYSKIAEELDLLNPDGSLYPISKEAILKYLRHQSKRIKSSNLHWYVNGLKKHQENLGFPWDDIRYDDQVVALLKELTLHPVTIVHGGSNVNNSSGVINGSSFGSEPYKLSAGHNYEEKPSSVQMKQSHSNGAPRSQIYTPPTTKPASYHSAPIQLSSAHGQGTLHQSRIQGQLLSPTIPATQQRSPISSSEIQVGLPPSTNALATEHRRHLASPTSPGNEIEEGFDAPLRNTSNEDQDSYQPEYMDEEPTERVALKRFASTGTLRSPARASAISVHPYPRPSDHRQRDDQSATLSPRARENEPGGGSLFFPVGSPDASSPLQSRVSPLGSAASIGSNSPANRNATGGPIPSTPRHKRTNGVVSSPISTVAAVIASAATAATAVSMPPSPIVPGKQTVQFSEVAEVAQRLQTQYGNQCTSHPWGCVELSEDFHLELTIKMYMDWAGLVASGRLTMDELPDLPEFRHPEGSGLSTSPPMTFVGGGTLKRMTSTPSTISMGSFSQHHRATMKSEELSPSLDNHYSRSSRFANINGGLRKHRSPSRSPIYGTSPKEGYLIESLMSRIGSPPPTSFLPSPPAVNIGAPFFSNKSGSSIGGEMSPRQKSTTPSTTTGGGLANSATRVRARRMASSPSLGQHHPSSSSSSQPTPPAHMKRGNSYGMTSPPLPSRPQFMPPMPPVPPLPLSLSVLKFVSGELLSKSGEAKCRLQAATGKEIDREDAGPKPESILSNSTASSPPSEDMDLSANEDEEDGGMVMMEEDDGREREDGVGYRVRGGEDSRPLTTAASPAALNGVSSRSNNSIKTSLRYYEDDREDLVMISSGIRDEARQEDKEEREFNEIEVEDEIVRRRNNDEDRGNVRARNSSEGYVPADLSLVDNTNTVQSDCPTGIGFNIKSIAQTKTDLQGRTSSKRVLIAMTISHDLTAITSTMLGQTECK
ncbi:hypothetical protein BGZ95_008995 [Linnemannia exigua]|uniref:Uncharacterized protein n=1 Tax=Linnemannia exigua TaxID=604196 RepID=A0AAD4HCF4_9FUNG|nr:hypothetical protein BGZ95_008995 [Linnemannia exigua]